MNIRRTMLALGLLALVALAALAAAAPRAGHAAAAGVEIQAITAGGFHNCALTTAGGIKCWGHNNTGQLGNGTLTTLESTPVDVSGLTSGVSAVAAAGGSTGGHNCAITTAGGLECWGWNNRGQLGDGTETDRASPVDVAGLAGGVAAVTAGNQHTCAVTSAGRVKCWGWNPLGQLGNGTTTNSSAPVDVCQDYDDVAEECTELLSGIAAVTAGSSHTCAITGAGGLKCWGTNIYGGLGAETDQLCPDPFFPAVLIPCSTTPVDVVGLGSGVAGVTAGSIHTCAVTTTGGVKCWGNNELGQLGAETDDFCTDPLTGSLNPCSAVPLDVVGLGSGVTGVDAGPVHHTCAVTVSGGVKCWGNNFRGRLGDGTTTDRATPVDVCQNYDTVAENCTEVLSGVTGVAAGRFHTCALTAAGGVKCWGSNCCGQLGNGTSDFDPHPTPAAVLGLGPEPTPTPTPTPSANPPPTDAKPTPTPPIAMLLPAAGVTAVETVGNWWLAAALSGAGGAAIGYGGLAWKRKEGPS